MLVYDMYVFLNRSTQVCGKQTKQNKVQRKAVIIPVNIACYFMLYTSPIKMKKHLAGSHTFTIKAMIFIIDKQINVYIKEEKDWLNICLFTLNWLTVA